MNSQSTNPKTAFVLVHEFDAPRELVFNAFANAEALNEWWGPVESRNTVIRLEFRPGGIFHYKMEAEWGVSYGRFLFGAIQPHELLEFTNAFADENANAVSAPFDISLPREIFYRLVFTSHDDKTTITLTGYPVDASAEEETGFYSINKDMQKGFAATFDKLAAYLRKQG